VHFNLVDKNFHTKRRVSVWNQPEPLQIPTTYFFIMMKDFMPTLKKYTLYMGSQWSITSYIVGDTFFERQSPVRRSPGMGFGDVEHLLDWLLVGVDLHVKETARYQGLGHDTRSIAAGNSHS
jgi:hypothetical protein